MNVQKVAILLSTFNGEAYLEKLLNSLLSQDYENFHIFVRDDGSSDGTLEILKRFSENEQIDCLYSENIGVVKSFFSLLEQCPIEADYYAFCDQDDEWDPKKVRDAVNVLNSNGGIDDIMLYFSALKYVSENGSFLRYSPPINIPPNFNGAILQNLAIGCTTVINNNARKKIVTNVNFSEVYMFDWWVFLVCSYFGNVYFSETAYINYRQHSNNTVGASANNILEKLFQWMRYFIKRPNRFISRQMFEFYRVYKHHLDSDHDELLREFVSIYRKNFFQRMLCVPSLKVSRQVPWQTILAKLLITLRLI